MIGAVHASVGAALGSLFRTRKSAFAAGIASHLIADAVPHTDFPAKIEVPLLAAALGCIAALCGADSPEFWGALGGVAPDVEHALLIPGLITTDQEIFPTHIRNGRYHGRGSGERWSQLLITIAAFTILAGSGSIRRGSLKDSIGGKDAVVFETSCAAPATSR